MRESFLQVSVWAQWLYLQSVLGVGQSWGSVQCLPGAKAGVRLVAEGDVPAQPVPQVLCSAQRYPASYPRLNTKHRALSAKGQVSLAPRNIHFADNVS